jgi:hypothetical protein|tara:strand:- start:115 stop:417 length:303 start_codon:yes stop_codon:yes gene_type:complete
MTKNKKDTTAEPTLNLNGVDYKINDMSDDQKVLLAHINDLNRKVDAAKFNLQQMEVGRNAFVGALSGALTMEEPGEEEDIRVTASTKRATPSPVPGGVAN